MRTARLLSVILTILTVGLAGGLPLAPPAGAQPPVQLSDYVTDDAHALLGSGRAAVNVGHRQALRRSPHPAVGGLRRRLLRDGGRELGAADQEYQRLRHLRRTAGRGHHRSGLRLPGAVGDKERDPKPGRQRAAQPDRTRAAQKRLERCGSRRSRRTEYNARFTGSGAVAGGTRRDRRRPGDPADLHAPARPPTPRRRPGRGTTGRSHRRQRLGPGATAGPRRPVPVDGGGGRQRGAHQLQRAHAGGRGVRRKPDGAIQQGGEQRQSGPFPGLHRASAARRRHRPAGGAAPPTAHSK